MMLEDGALLVMRVAVMGRFNIDRFWVYGV